jgi:cephalosporin hydroxylase
MDMWVKQEILFEVKPDLIIECGTHRGGTALYYATLMAVINPEARIITIDVENRVERAGTYDVFKKHCTQILGDSTSPDVAEQVKALAQGKKVLVVLDSLHRKEHVLKEMELYGPLVTPGSYMIVEDTDINGHPVMPNYGPGPHEAVMEYLKAHPGAFSVDRLADKMLFSLHPDGYLKKL